MYWIVKSEIMNSVNAVISLDQSLIRFYVSLQKKVRKMHWSTPTLPHSPPPPNSLKHVSTLDFAVCMVVLSILYIAIIDPYKQHVHLPCHYHHHHHLHHHHHSCYCYCDCYNNNNYYYYYYYHDDDHHHYHSHYYFIDIVLYSWFAVEYDLGRLGMSWGLCCCCFC